MPHRIFWALWPWLELLARTCARKLWRRSFQGLTAHSRTCGPCSWHAALSFFSASQSLTRTCDPRLLCSSRTPSSQRSRRAIIRASRRRRCHRTSRGFFIETVLCGVYRPFYPLSPPPLGPPPHCTTPHQTLVRTRATPEAAPQRTLHTNPTYSDFSQSFPRGL